MRETATTGRRTRCLLPDPYLALIVCGVVLAAAIEQTVIRAENGGCVRLYPEPGMIALLYVVFESIRHARPLVGALVGALGAAATIAPMFMGEFEHPRPDSLVQGALALAAAIAAGAAVGLVLATLAWLTRRLLKLKAPVAEPVPHPRFSGWLLVIIILLTIVPVAESFGWSYQAQFRGVLGMWEQGRNPWHGWGIFYRLDRIALVALASLAAYSMVRRWRWARHATVVYLLVGLAVTLVRAWFYHAMRVEYPLPEFGSLPAPGSDYQLANMFIMPLPSVTFEALLRANLVEAGGRLLACMVVTPYLFFSRNARHAFARGTRPTPAPQ